MKTQIQHLKTIKMTKQKIKKKIVELKYSDIPKIREKLRLEQNNICPICKKEIQSPVLDHHHRKKIKGTGLCRGVCCSLCNTFIGLLENRCQRYLISQNDLPNILRNTADYLDAPQTNYLHPTEKKEKRKKFYKRDYNKLKKYYFKVYPKRKDIPEYPEPKKKNGIVYLNKEFGKMLDDLTEYLKNAK